MKTMVSCKDLIQQKTSNLFEIHFLLIRVIKYLVAYWNIVQRIGFSKNKGKPNKLYYIYLGWNPIYKRSQKRNKIIHAKISLSSYESLIIFISPFLIWCLFIYLIILAWRWFFDLLFMLRQFWKATIKTK